MIKVIKSCVTYMILIIDTILSKSYFCINYYTKQNVMKKLKLIILAIVLSTSGITFGQSMVEDLNTAGTTNIITNLHLDKNKSSFVIKGTSSLHDWEMNSESFSGEISFTKTES